MEIQHNLLLCGEPAKKATAEFADCDRFGVLPQCFRGLLRGIQVCWLRTNKTVS
jgi:hypothetical protein